MVMVMVMVMVMMVIFSALVRSHQPTYEGSHFIHINTATVHNFLSHTGTRWWDRILSHTQERPKFHIRMFLYIHICVHNAATTREVVIGPARSARAPRAAAQKIEPVQQTRNIIAVPVDCAERCRIECRAEREHRIFHHQESCLAAISTESCLAQYGCVR